MKVEVQSRKLVKPSAPTPYERRKLGLSFIDDLLFPDLVCAIFYYRAHEKIHQIDTLRRRRLLEESLSETLALFYPLAGRYIEGGLFVDCNDQGAEFVQAKADGTLDRLLQGDLDRDLLSCLWKSPPQAANNPLVVVQVNEFDCGGLAISLQFSHKICDMYTIATFVNSWATACRSGIHEVAPPNFELASLFPATEPTFGERPAIPLGGKFGLARLQFSGVALSRLKAASNASNSSDSTANNSQRSRVEIVSALICKALISVNRTTKGLPPRPFVFSTPMNLRTRVQLKIPMNACGNFVALITTPRTVEEGEPTYNEVLNLIGDAIKNAKVKYAAIADAGGLCSTVGDSFRDLIGLFGRDEANVILIGNWCGFPLYESDFGWGKPDLVSHASPPMKSVCLLDSPSDGGIDAWITLNPEEMVLFKQDPDIVACTS